MAYAPTFNSYDKNKTHLGQILDVFIYVETLIFLVFRLKSN